MKQLKNIYQTAITLFSQTHRVLNPSPSGLHDPRVVPRGSPAPGSPSGSAPLAAPADELPPGHVLVHVDHQPDQGLEDHGGEQVHVDAGHLVLTEFPGI